MLPAHDAGHPQFSSSLSQIPLAGTGEKQGGGEDLPIIPPPLSPPARGGEPKRMPFIPALPGGAFWYVLIKVNDGS
jgi:hypothetical protein